MARPGTGRLVGWVTRSSLTSDETTGPSASFQEAADSPAARWIPSSLRHREGHSVSSPWEAYLRLTTEIRAGRAPDNTRAWLYRVGANLAVSRGRRISAAFRGIVKIRGTSAPPTTTFTPEASYLGRQGRADLLAALADLGPDARAALLLAAEGFTGAEIAAAIGRSDAATRTLLCRTRVQVRSRLESAEAVR